MNFQELRLVMSSYVKAFLLSCVAHILLFLCLWRVPYSKQNLKPQSQIVQIEYNQLPIRQMGSGDSKKPQSHIATKSTYKLFDSKIDFNSVLANKKADQATSSDIYVDNYNNSPSVDNVDAAWGVGAGTFERAKDYILMKKIYEHVDNALFFPSFFHRNNIEGAINARLVIDFEGKCDWSKIKFYGEQPYMKLFVLSVLKSACRQNFKPFLKQRLLTVVDLSFQFELTEPTNSQRIEKNKYIVGNTLMFYRNSYKSIMEWEFGPFQGIFPVPAIYLNIPWIQENWDKIMYSKDPITEFKKEFGS